MILAAHASCVLACSDRLQAVNRLNGAVIFDEQFDPVGRQHLGRPILHFTVKCRPACRRRTAKCACCAWTLAKRLSGC